MNDATILQVGIVHCNDGSSPDLCAPGHMSSFWAYGGCGVAEPTGRFIGQTDDNQHTYEIRHFSTPQSGYSMYIDGTYTSKTIYANNSAVSCWLTSRHGAQYASETEDAGDGIADAGAPVISSSIGWRITDTGTWQAPTWSGTSPCYAEVTTIYLDLNCDISNADITQFYTWSTFN
jgi:hypothetical protein